MKVIKCDKCKKEIEMITSLDSMNKVKFSFKGTLHEALAYSGEYDLCDYCYKRLFELTNNYMGK